MNARKRSLVSVLALMAATVVSVQSLYAAPPAPTNAPSLDSLPKPDLSTAPLAIQQGAALQSSLSADQLAAIQAVLGKYQPEITASAEALLQQRQAGPKAGVNKALFASANNLVSQINAEISSVLNADQQTLLTAATSRNVATDVVSAPNQADSSVAKVAPMAGPTGTLLREPLQQVGQAGETLSLPSEAIVVQPDAAAAPNGADAYTSNCYYSPYYLANYVYPYAYYAYLYSYYDYLNTGRSSAYNAYYYSYYSYYYTQLALDYAGPVYFYLGWTGFYPSSYPYYAYYYAYYADYYAYYGNVYAYYNYYTYGTTYGYYGYYYAYYANLYSDDASYYAYYCYYYS